MKNVRNYVVTCLKQLSICTPSNNITWHPLRQERIACIYILGRKHIENCDVSNITHTAENIILLNIFLVNMTLKNYLHWALYLKFCLATGRINEQTNEHDVHGMPTRDKPCIFIFTLFTLHIEEKFLELSSWKTKLRYSFTALGISVALFPRGDNPKWF